MRKKREASLDFSRFWAASIVFVGHLLFLPNTYKWTPETTSNLDFIRTGETAVLYFFALSGYVLAYSERSSTYFSWVRRRLLRLFPVYITAWLLGLALVTLHNASLPNSWVLLFGFTGTSAFSPKFNLAGNPPLWSLSVEIIYAFLLFYLLKIKHRPYLAFCVISLSLLAWYEFTEAPILRALAYFSVGVFLRNRFFVELQVNRILSSLLLFVGLVLYVAKGASWLVNAPDSLGNEILILCLVSSVILILSKISIQGLGETVSIDLGKRSFCFYAFHYPVLLIVDYIIKPYDNLSLMLYIFLSIVATLILTELTFRCIDKPSTKWAAKKFMK